MKTKITKKSIEQAFNNTQAALTALSSERAYQEHRWPGHQHTIGEWLLIMEKCLNDGKRCYVTGHGNERLALHEIRQVTAVGLAAMEQHGAPPREGF